MGHGEKNDDKKKGLSLNTSFGLLGVIIHIKLGLGQPMKGEHPKDILVDRKDKTAGLVRSFWKLLKCLP